MKTFKIILLSALIVLTANAKDKVVLHPIGSLGTFHPHVIPTVTSDNNDVNISCDSTLYDVEVVIRDQYGNIMHRSTQTIDPTGTVSLFKDYVVKVSKTCDNLTEAQQKEYAKELFDAIKNSELQKEAKEEATYTTNILINSSIYWDKQ